MKSKFAALSAAVALLAVPLLGGASLTLSRADYVDRVQAIWTGQIIAVLSTFPYEHGTASTEWLDRFHKPYPHAIVDDDWYYEMCAIRGFEKYGIGMTAEQLGRQWLENSCGSWGASAQALANLKRGIPAPASGHPRYNRLWFTLGPQFSADVYGALAPGMPNTAGRMAREYGHVNGYAEGTDGAVFTAAMVSLGFVERDPRVIVRRSVRLLDPSSPYRQCIELVIAGADAGQSFEEVVNAVEDRWHIEYPATNNAVANGGIVAAGLWFGAADFWRTVNLIARAGDFTDADCNAANAAAVIGAIHGMKSMPREQVAQLGDRIAGTKLGGVELTPPVDESISGLSQRTAAIGEKIILAGGGKIDGNRLVITPQVPKTQAAERFVLGDLMQWWNPDWTLERAGHGGAGGGMAGIRGITYLDGDTLATYPRDETRGVVLRRTARLSAQPALDFQVAAVPNRAWELSVYVNNQRLHQQLVAGAAQGEDWHPVHIDLGAFAGKEVTLRLYQRVLMPTALRLPGNALWKELRLR